MTHAWRESRLAQERWEATSARQFQLLTVLCFLADGITGSACEADCSSVQDGDYQSCDSCTEYVTCSGGQQVISDCENQKTWDNSLQECQDDDSTTCVQPAVQDERGDRI